MTKNTKIKIFVTHHKPWYVFKDDVYTPIQVGKKSARVDLGFLWDDTWDNISERNHDYAELTAQYRVRKNYDLSSVDYVWFCHYRRYFSYKYIPNPILSIKTIFKEASSLRDFIVKIIAHFLGIVFFAKKDDIKDIEKNIFMKVEKLIKNDKQVYNIYVPKKSYILRWLKQLWIKNNKIWRILESSINKNNPQYKQAILKLENEYRFNIGNMFIMDVNSFKQYESWLFDILFTFEERIKEEWLFEELLKEPIVESWFRPYWYISEFLLTLWLMYNNKNLKIYKKLNVVMIL